MDDEPAEAPPAPEDPMRAFSAEVGDLMPHRILQDWATNKHTERDLWQWRLDLVDRMQRSICRLAGEPPEFVFSCGQALRRQIVIDQDVRANYSQVLGEMDDEMSSLVAALTGDVEERGNHFNRAIWTAQRYRTWLQRTRTTMMDGMTPALSSQLDIDPSERLRLFNVRFMAAQRDELPEVNLYQMMMDRLLTWFYQRGFALYNGAIYSPIPGTEERAMEPMYRAVSEQTDVRKLMTITNVVWAGVAAIPDLSWLVRTHKTAPQTLETICKVLKETQAGSDMMKTMQPSYRYFAIPETGVLQIASDPRKRTSSGEMIFESGSMRPMCKMLPFGMMPGRTVAFRALDGLWVDGQEDFPMGFLQLLPEHQLHVVPDNTVLTKEGRDFEEHMARRGRQWVRWDLAPEPDEGSYDWLRRFARQFRQVERTPEQLRAWLQTSHTFHVCDLWWAHERVWVEWKRGLAPELRDDHLTPDEVRRRAREQGLEPPPWPFEGTLLGLTGSVLQVMAFQRLSDQSMFMVWAMLGRGLHWGKLSDSWHALVLYIGEPRAGKGHIQGVLSDLYTVDDILTIDGKVPDKHALPSLVKRLVIFPDLTKLNAGVDSDFLLKAAANEFQVARAVYKDPETGSFLARIFAATNNRELLKGKAMHMRSVITMFCVDPVAQGYNHGFMATWRREHVTASLCFAARAYLAFHETVGGSSMMLTLPLESRDVRLSYGHNQSLVLFLAPNSRWFVYREGARTSLADLIARFDAVKYEPPPEDGEEARPIPPVLPTDSNLHMGLWELGCAVKDGVVVNGSLTACEEPMAW